MGIKSDLSDMKTGLAIFGDNREPLNTYDDDNLLK